MRPMSATGSSLTGNAKAVCTLLVVWTVAAYSRWVIIRMGAHQTTLWSVSRSHQSWKRSGRHPSRNDWRRPGDEDGGWETDRGDETEEEKRRGITRGSKCTVTDSDSRSLTSRVTSSQSSRLLALFHKLSDMFDCYQCGSDLCYIQRLNQ